MSTTKRIAASALAGIFALMLALLLPVVAPGTSTKAEAAGGLGMTLTIAKPVDGDSTTYTKYKSLDVSSSQIFGTPTCSGSWAPVSGSNSYFHNNQTFKYTATLAISDAMGGFAGATGDPGYANEIYFVDKDTNQRLEFTNVTTTLSSDSKKLTVTGLYTVGEPAGCVNLFEVNSNLNTVTLKWLVDDDELWDGCYIYVDDVALYDFQPASRKDTNVITSIKVPYGSSHTVYVRAYFNGKEGAPSNTITVKGVDIKSPTPVATKINANKVCIAWSKPKGATGVKIYANGKKIKTSTGSYYTYSKTGAGSMKYYAIAYVTDSNGTTNFTKSKTVGISANVKSGVSPSPSYYGYTLTNYLNITKLKYTKANSKGKVKATFTITNCWKKTTTQKCKVKITLKTRSGAKIASQTFTVKGIKPWSKKVFTKTFSKSKTGCDLKTAKMSYSIQVIR